MRVSRANKSDENQSQIVAALRKAGASVQPLNRIGDGCPDLLCAASGKLILFEVKRNAKTKLNSKQVKWIAGWRSDVYVVYTAEDAVSILNVIRQEKGQ